MTQANGEVQEAPQTALELSVYDQESAEMTDATAQATVRDSPSPSTMEIDIDLGGIAVNVGLEARDGEVLLVISTTEKRSQDGTPAYGDSTALAKVRLGEVEVLSATTRKKAIFDD